jgi:hypothetical protein
VDADEIEVGKSYAYVAQGHQSGPHHPVRAVVTAEPEGGYAEVTLYFPDTGQDGGRVKTRELVGEWDAEPASQQYAAARQAAHDRGETLTWEHIAERRYAEVARQRALASRLLRFGIQREARPYAGRGGTSTKPHDVDLQLNYDEIEKLLDAAERGPGTPAPFAGAFTPPETVDVNAG